MRTTASRLLPLCLAACASLVTGRALAGSAEDEARRLFEEGSAAERAGNTAGACAKFRQSLGLVREVGPLSKVKDCDVRENKLVSGAANLRELITRWPQPGPELEALKAELATVEKRIPHLTLTLRSGAPLGVSARLDGGAVDFPASTRAVDPGKHELLVDVPGRPLERITIELRDGEQKSIELPSEIPPTPPAPLPKVEPAGLGPLGIAGIVVGAIGVGGFVGAAVTGKLVLDKQDEFESSGCGADGQPDAPGCPTIASDGDALLVTNGVLWGVGIAGVAVGATLLIVDLVGSSSESRASSASLTVRPGYGELTIRF